VGGIPGMVESHGMFEPPCLSDVHLWAGIQLLRGKKYGRYKNEELTTTKRQKNAHHHQDDALCQKLYQVHDLTS
jgi:hypothetical protein